MQTMSGRECCHEGWKSDSVRGDFAIWMVIVLMSMLLTNKEEFASRALILLTFHVRRTVVLCHSRCVSLMEYLFCAVLDLRFSVLFSFSWAIFSCGLVTSRTMADIRNRLVKWCVCCFQSVPRVSAGGRGFLGKHQTVGVDFHPRLENSTLDPK